MELNKKTVRTILLIITFTVLLLVAVQNLASIYDAIARVWDIFGVVTGGLALAFVLNVPLKQFENRLLYGMCESKHPFVRRMHRPASLFCAVILALGLVVLLFVIVLPQLTRTVSEIAVKIPDYIASVVGWVEETLESFKLSTGFLDNLSIDWENAIIEITSYLKNGVGGIIGTATNIGTTLVSSAMDIAFSLIIAVYVLADKERIGMFVSRCVRAFLPKRLAGGLTRLATMSASTFSSFIAGQLTDSFILGVLCYFGMIIFGFPYPGVISVVIGVSSLVPMVGTFIGEVIGVFLILLVSPIKALLFIVFILCLQQIEGSFIYPRVVGKSVGLPGVIVLCAVIVGGNIAGVLGALLGVPVCAVLYALLRSTVNSRLKES